MTWAFIIGLSGCGNESGRQAYPVRGKVLFNGRPVVNGQVTFHPVGDTSRDAVRAVGKVDEQGSFALTTFKDGDGAPAGDYRVTVVWYLARPARPGTASDETVTANYLPAKYANVETSGLSVTVKQGANDLPPFDLK